MNELISGKEALIALANGEAVDYRVKNGTWVLVNDDWKIREFDQSHYEFRLKPRTITINGVEVPAPFEPKEDDQFWYIAPRDKQGYGTDICCNHEHNFYISGQLSVIENYGAWRTEEEIKQVVAALRSIFGKK